VVDRKENINNPHRVVIGRYFPRMCTSIFAYSYVRLFT